MTLPLQIIPTLLLEDYKNSFDQTIHASFDQLYDSELSVQTFISSISVSAVFSSRIAGEEIELDSYLQHKLLGKPDQADYTRKIDDLYDAYLFTQKTSLSAGSLTEAHAQLTKNILQESQQGQFRTTTMNVLTKDGTVEYAAATPRLLFSEMLKFYVDLDQLLSTDLSFEEVFYFASMLHLVLVNIHPFEDGNGRMARLLEKWFLVEKLGPSSWFIQSEKYYYEQQQKYFANIRRLGSEYGVLNYSEALPFLQMLPNSLQSNT